MKSFIDFIFEETSAGDVVSATDVVSKVKKLKKIIRRLKPKEKVED